MTAYEVIPVGAGGVERERSQVVRVTPCSELHAENVRLRQALAEETNLRISFQVRLSKASRVLASLGRLSPRMAALVAAARREIFGELR